ncbi:MAG TPA: right-handed parallel beta-helix repeat-containing protein [Gaiellaceae bacterium]
MSYSLRGRVDSRLAALLPVLLAACVLAGALGEWWPVELVALMAAVGLVLDVQLYDRVLDYQPAWLAVPLGLLELGVIMAVVRIAGIAVPLWPAVALFGAGWLVAQVLGHAGFPLLRLSYGDDGGELGLAGVVNATAVAATVVACAGFAYAQRPPTVHLASGVHRGPIVITRREILEGESGTIVRGGIVVRANDVTIRNLAVVGGENGIVVDGYHGVKIEHVAVSGAKLDGIHVRRAAVSIRDCSVATLDDEYGQGIDISYGADKGENSIMGCSIVGGLEGITVHSSNVMIGDNTVTGTRLNGIAVTEMSMGMVEHNQVRDGRSVGISCNDHSMCEIEHNVVVGMRPDGSGNLWQLGFGVLASYNSEAELDDNDLASNPRPAAAVLDSQLERR